MYRSLSLHNHALFSPGLPSQLDGLLARIGFAVGPLRKQPENPSEFLPWSITLTSRHLSLGPFLHTTQAPALWSKEATGCTSRLLPSGAEGVTHARCQWVSWAFAGSRGEPQASWLPSEAAEERVTPTRHLFCPVPFHPAQTLRHPWRLIPSSVCCLNQHFVSRHPTPVFRT